MLRAWTCDRCDTGQCRCSRRECETTGFCCNYTQDDFGAFGIEAAPHPAVLGPRCGPFEVLNRFCAPSQPTCSHRIAATQRRPANTHRIASHRIATVSVTLSRHSRHQPVAAATVPCEGGGGGDYSTDIRLFLQLLRGGTESLLLQTAAACPPLPARTEGRDGTGFLFVACQPQCSRRSNRQRRSPLRCCFCCCCC